jgi:hypothetical protein
MRRLSGKSADGKRADRPDRGVGAPPEQRFHGLNIPTPHLGCVRFRGTDCRLHSNRYFVDSLRFSVICRADLLCRPVAQQDIVMDRTTGNFGLGTHIHFTCARVAIAAPEPREIGKATKARPLSVGRTDQEPRGTQLIGEAKQVWRPLVPMVSSPESRREADLPHIVNAINSLRTSLGLRQSRQEQGGSHQEKDARNANACDGEPLAC